MMKTIGCSICGEKFTGESNLPPFDWTFAVRSQPECYPRGTKVIRLFTDERNEIAFGWLPYRTKMFWNSLHHRIKSNWMNEFSCHQRSLHVGAQLKTVWICWAFVLVDKRNDWSSYSWRRNGPSSTLFSLHISNAVPCLCWVFVVDTIRLQCIGAVEHLKPQIGAIIQWHYWRLIEAITWMELQTRTLSVVRGPNTPYKS